MTIGQFSSSARLFPLGLLCVLAMSCVTGVEPEGHVPVPFVESVAPGIVAVADTTTTVTVIGRGFLESAVVLVDSQSVTTQFVSATEVRAALDPLDIGVPGVRTVTVSNTGLVTESSSGFELLVGLPAPVLDSMTPSSGVSVSGGGLTIRVFGSDFTSHGTGSRVVAHRVAIPTTFLSSSELQAVLPEHLLREGRSFPITVANPAPGGGPSGELLFGLDNPVPVLTGVTPDRIRLGDAADFVIQGSGFVTGMTVWLDSVPYTPTASTPTSLSFSIPRQAPVRGGGSLHVRSPGPGGGPSSDFTLFVQERIPEFDGTLPSAIEVGEGTLLVHGTGFAPDATVTWNGAARATTFVHPDTLLVDFEPADVDAVTTGALEVVNPREGGPSGPRQLSIVPFGRLAILGGVDVPGAISYARDSTRRLNGTDVVPGSQGSGWHDTSPAGDSIAVSGASVETSTGLDVIAGDGTRTTIYDGLATTPGWSDDGWIYFGPHTLARVRSDGSEYEELLVEDSLGIWNRWPDPSPSGDRLSFGHFPSDTVGAAVRDDLRILDIGTGDVTSLGVPAHDSEWSPDGQWIAYRTPDGILSVIRPDGSDNRVIYDAARVQPGFDWSPDGTLLLAVVAGRPRLFPLDGGPMIPLPFTNSRNVSWFANPGGS